MYIRYYENMKVKDKERKTYTVLKVMSPKRHYLKNRKGKSKVRIDSIVRRT